MGRDWNRRRRQFIARAREGEALWWRRDYFRPLEDPTPWHLFSGREKGAQPFTDVWVAECGESFNFDETNLEIVPRLRHAEPKENSMCAECRYLYFTEWTES